MAPHPLPDLPTHADPPSWVNYHRRIDRSACVELRASELVRLARLDDPQMPGIVPPPPIPSGATRRVATALIHLTARQLMRLHLTRPPRHLRGDFRWKTYAMQPDGGRMGSRWERSTPHHATTRPKGRAPELPDPLARDRFGRTFAHDQLRHPLPKSALTNKHTRAAALAKAAAKHGKTRGDTPRLADNRANTRRHAENRAAPPSDWQAILDQFSLPTQPPRKATSRATKKKR